MISMIWAMDKNYLIGKDNKLPWHYKEDLQFFKKMTNNKTVLMGENTYYSMLEYYKKGLPFKKIYLCSFNDNIKGENIIIIKDLLSFLKYNIEEDIFCIGGRTIYNYCFDYANKLYVTLIDKEYIGDTYFPRNDFSDFKIIESNSINELNFITYERIVH